MSPFVQGFLSELGKNAALPIVGTSLFPGVQKLRVAARIGRDVQNTIKIGPKKALKEPWVK